MSYAKLICIEFYSCYLWHCHSIDLFSYMSPGHVQKGHMNKFCPSFCSEVSLELALQFFHEVNMVLGVHVVLCMTEPDFLEIMFSHQNGASPEFFESSIEKFSFSQFFVFFINLVYNESLYYSNSCMTKQISYLGKFWFL